MTVPGKRCQLSFLVPHPRRPAIVVADDPSAGPNAPLRLPTAYLNDAEPLVSEMLAAVDVPDRSTAVVLRTVMTASAVDENEISLLVECDDNTAELPPGWVWLDLDDHAIARLEPASSRAAVASWLRERADGWSPLRPAWSRPGWFARASEWMVEQMAAVGRAAVEPPRQHWLWGISAVLRAPSADGDVFLKCSGELFRREAVLTLALARLMPDVLPEVLAVDEAHGWLLMRDLDAAELGEQAESLWHHGLVTHARIQRAMLSRTHELVELGLADRSLTRLAAWVGQLSTDAALLERMPADLRERWLATFPALVESCLRLDALGPGPSLVHGDLHPWNVVYGHGVTRVFDWTDAAVSHPFIDLATYVFRTRDVAVRRNLIDAYVAAWSTEGSDVSVREAAALALVVGALFQVQSYRMLLPTLMADGANDDLGDGDLGWLDRALVRHEQGVESPT